MLSRTDRNLVRALFALSTIVAVAAACADSSEDGATPTPTCTPPPAIDVDLTVLGVNATASVGKPVAMRVLVGTTASPTVMTCTTAQVAAGGGFSISGQAFGPLFNLRAELFISSDGDPAFGGDADRHYVFHPETDGLYSGTLCDVNHVWTVPLDVSTAGERAIAWSSGLACPGQ